MQQRRAEEGIRQVSDRLGEIAKALTMVAGVCGVFLLALLAGTVAGYSAQPSALAVLCVALYGTIGAVNVITGGSVVGLSDRVGRRVSRVIEVRLSRSVVGDLVVGDSGEQT